jgi:hypothetical protein
MPVSVHIPIRIRTDPQAVSERLDDLEEALSAALRRALANSREVVLARRGGFVTTVLNRPQVTWCGAGLDRISSSDRSRLEECIAGLCAEICGSENIATWGRQKPATAAGGLTAISEPLDDARWDSDRGLYSIPSYDKPRKIEAVPTSESGQAKTKFVELATFWNYAEVYEAILSFYGKDFAPKGNRRTGVYGIWGPVGKPQLIWVTGIVEEGPRQGSPIFDSMPWSGGRVQNKRFETDGRQPVSLTLGERYYLVGLTSPKRSKGVEYIAEWRERLDGKGKPVFTTDQRIAGKVIRFGVPKVTIEIDESAAIRIEGKAPVAPAPGQPVSPLPPTLAREGIDAWANMLPATPQDGEPAWLWWWFVWFNVRPAEVRALMPLRKVFTDLENAGARDKAIELNWAWELGQWQTLIYRRYCRHLALELLETSRRNMAEFKATLHGSGFKGRLMLELSVLQQPAEQLTEVARLPALEAELSALREGEYDEGPRGKRITLRMPNPRAAAALQPAVEHARSLLAHAEDNRTILKFFQEMDPLLAIFSLGEDRPGPSIGPIISAAGTTWAALAKDMAAKPGYRTIPLESGIVAAAGKTPEELVKIMEAKLEWMVAKTWEATREITNDRDVASKLHIVQQIANEQLEPWFAEVSSMRGAMELVTQTSWFDWILLGFALLVLTFAFPPAGIALSAGVAVGTAIHSTLQARQLSRLGQARLAQFGLTPLASEAEINAAWFEAAVNILFAVVELGALAKGLVGAAARAAERAAAREALGVVSERIERLLAGWRNFDQWPPALRGQIRGRVAAQLEKRGLAAAAQLEDAAVASLQKEMLFRYEQELLRFQRKFGEAIASKALSPRDVEAMSKWLQGEFKQPKKFLEELGAEFQPGKSLFDDTLGRQLANLPPIERTVLDFFEGLGEKELKEVAAGLSNAALLTPNRLAALAKEGGVPLTYRELAARLDNILVRVENPERALGMIEDLLSGRPDAGAILQGLGNSTNPRRALEAMLGPKVLEAPMAGGVGELFEAFAAPAKSGGRVGRIVADADEKGAIRLFREVEESGGARAVERWDGKAHGWVPDPKARIAAAAPGRTVAEVSAEAEASALDELFRMATETRPSGGLTSEAVRARGLLEKIKAHPVRSEIAKAVAREGRETGSRLVDNLAYLLEDGVKGKELDGLADFLRRGGTGGEAADILRRGAREGGGIFRDRIRGFFEKVPRFRDADFAGITVVLGSRATRLDGAEAVLDILRNFPEPEFVFGALADLAPRADGIRRLVGYLRRFGQNEPKAASAQLKAAAELLQEFPGHRIVFEAAVEDTAGALIREIDVRIVTQYSRTTVLDVELKEISDVFFLKGSRPRQQFARDVVRSVQTARPGERALGGMRWLIRENEILGKYMAKNAITDIAKAREAVLKQLQEVLEKAFGRDELKALSEAQLAAAKKDFAEHFKDIVKLF